jgi:hypothetical protein
MEGYDKIFYKMLLIGTPVLLGIIGYVCNLGVKALFRMGEDITDSKSTLKEAVVKHDNLEDRVTRVETRIDRVEIRTDRVEDKKK